MNIKKLEKLLELFRRKGIVKDSTKKGFQSTLDFQDVIGGATYQDILEWYTRRDQLEREYFVWICSVCLSMTTLLEIIKKVVCNKIIQDVEDAYSDLYDRKCEKLQEEYKDAADTKMERDALKKQTEILNTTLQDKYEKILFYQKKAEQNREDAGKYRQIKTLILT